MRAGTVLVLVAALACRAEEPAPLYEPVAVTRRDIVVAASAAGAIEPVLTVDVKSLASGEILEMLVETGDDVRAGQLLLRVDPRQPRNELAQAEANLAVARAQLENARAQLGRADTLFRSQAITQAEHENARLAYANANAQVVRADADLELARDQMGDTQVRAPVTGTIIQTHVALGTVISSPTRDVGGGTLLLQMANLDTVQVRALVDETDIGKIQPGMEVTIAVDAYPNRPFEGAVLKIEPQATVQQNVTMFPVLVRFANPNHLLKPGMNSEVEIHVGEQRDAMAIPYAALRTRRDMSSAAQLLGLDAATVEADLAAASDRSGDTSSAPRTVAGETRTITLGNGRTVSLPAGVSPEQAREVFRKRTAGGALTAAEQEILQMMRAARGGAGQRPGARRSTAGEYIVFALRNGRPTAVSIRTGLTDLDYIEVLSGLTERDTVLLLPSASLVQSQQELRERVQRFTGGGLPGVQQQSTERAAPRR